MTAGVWIGYVKIRARTEEARFWAPNANTVVTRMLVSGSGPEAYQQQLSLFFEQRELELLEVLSLAEVPATGMPELNELAANASEPLLFDRLCDAAKCSHVSVNEVTQSALVHRDGLWAVLDGVAWPDLPRILARSGEEHVCLYSSTDPGTLALAPWLVRLSEGSQLQRMIFDLPTDSHCGIFLESNLSARQLRRHLRRFMMVVLPDRGSTPVYFRFYDPRVALDMAGALDSETLAFFLHGCSALYVRLSPLCVLPDGANIALPITPFDDPNAYRNRIASISASTAPLRERGGILTLKHHEQARFKSIQRRKSIRALARQLSKEFPNRSYRVYREIAHAAPKAAADFNMTSTIQVSVLARAMMMRGPSFWLENEEAANILNRKNILPWQKKEALMQWLIDSELPIETFL